MNATALEGDRTARCYLMLDIDGVLHPLDAEPGAYFSFLSALETVLRDIPDVDVVIASSWRHTHLLTQLRAIFSPDLRDRIVGVTPDIPPAMGDTDQGSRHREILSWLDENGRQGVPWIALDDAPSLYFRGAPVLVVPDGFGDAEAIALRTALTDPDAFRRMSISATPERNP